MFLEEKRAASIEDLALVIVPIEKERTLARVLKIGTPSAQVGHDKEMLRLAMPRGSVGTCNAHVGASAVGNTEISMDQAISRMFREAKIESTAQ